MKIAEIYKSIQGEGRLTGTASVFVRTSGCNLRCWFCDTPYASWSPQGQDLPVHEIVDQILLHGCEHVVLTGGEPMLFAELIPLCHVLKSASCHVTIETAGTLYLPVVCDLMSISPKFSSSAPAVGEYPAWNERHERTRYSPQVIRQLLRQYNYQIKFVIDVPSDCDAAECYLRDFPEIERNQVYLMPQGTELEQLSSIKNWLYPYCQQHKLHFCPRKQIEWFGLVRGT